MNICIYIYRYIYMYMHTKLTYISICTTGEHSLRVPLLICFSLHKPTRWRDRSVRHCNSLQHAAIHCSTLQH